VHIAIVIELHVKDQRLRYIGATNKTRTSDAGKKLTRARLQDFEGKSAHPPVCSGTWSCSLPRVPVSHSGRSICREALHTRKRYTYKTLVLVSCIVWMVELANAHQF